MSQGLSFPDSSDSKLGQPNKTKRKTGTDLGVTRVTSHPLGAAAYFMLFLCVKAIYTFLISCPRPN